jgi:hypothetical protein
MITLRLQRRLGSRTLQTVRAVFGGAGGVLDMHPEDPRLLLGLRGPLKAFEALWPDLKNPGDPPLLDALWPREEEP